jgi:hypothetical protein
MAPAVLAAQDDAPAEPAPNPFGSALITVHGVVRNAATGEPLPRALVRIEGDAATGALTDGDGRFEISGLPPGPQLFEAIKPGYQDRPYAAGAPVMDEATGIAHNVLVTAQMPDLVLTLAPTCAIRGQIELSTGDPAQGITVQLLKRTVQDGRAVWQATSATRTTSEGTYRFSGLPDGVYAVYTDPAMDSEPATNLVAAGSAGHVARDGYASVFFPDARDLAGAAKIRLTNGEQAQANISLTLEPFQTVTATATFPDARSGGADAAVDRSGTTYAAVVLDAQGHQLPYAAQYDQGTKTIQALLPDGTYSLLFTERRFTARLSMGSTTWNLNQSGGPYVGSVDFAVAGKTISNLRVPLSVPHSSAVQVTLVRSEASAARTGQSQGGEILVMLSQAGGWIADGLSSTYAQGDGTGPMEATYLPPGPYWVHTRIAQRGLCESSFTAGGANLAREPLVLGLSGATAPLELTVRDDCAKLTLTLPAALAAMTAGEEPFYTIYAVPDFDSTVDLEPVTLRPSTGATVTLEGLTPGSYHVYTFENPVALEYRNRTALAALPDPGQTITLSAGTTGSLVLEAPGH